MVATLGEGRRREHLGVHRGNVWLEDFESTVLRSWSSKISSSYIFAIGEREDGPLHSHQKMTLLFVV
jgi:hypothetical protein